MPPIRVDIPPERAIENGIAGHLIVNGQPNEEESTTLKLRMAAAISPPQCWPWFSMGCWSEAPPVCTGARAFRRMPRFCAGKMMAEWRCRMLNDSADDAVIESSLAQRQARHQPHQPVRSAKLLLRRMRTTKRLTALLSMVRRPSMWQVLPIACCGPPIHPCWHGCILGCRRYCRVVTATEFLLIVVSAFRGSRFTVRKTNLPECPAGRSHGAPTSRHATTSSRPIT